MATAQRVKASDKQAVCKKLVTVLKKRYKTPLPRHNRPTLETILFGICLEDATLKQAEASYRELFDRFHDLNEIRVSSISELRDVFQGLPEPEQRAMQVRNTLQYVFENQFDFDFELLRKKTFELASKQLARVNGLSPFVRAYVLQTALGGHVIPLDRSAYNAVLWLGLIEPDESPESASESLKSVVRKADAPRFCHLLRCLATDPAVRPKLESAVRKTPDEGFDVETAPDRLADFLKEASARRKKKTAGKRGTNKKRAPARRTGRKSSANSRKKKTTGRKKTPSRTKRKMRK